MPVVPVSVIIPALNAEAFIRDAIESVRAQTLSVAEIIVVDNGCTDATAQIAAEAGARVVEREKRGISAARNAGIEASLGQWVALLDADDEWNKRKIELQWSIIEACPQAGIVSCDFCLTRDGQVVESIPEKLLRERWENYQGRRAIGQDLSFIPKVDAGMFPRFFPSPSTVMLRRDVFKEVGLFDEDVLFSEDFEYFMRVFARFPLAIVELPLVRHRQHAAKHSLHLDQMRDGSFAVVSKMFEHPERYPPGAGEYFRERFKSSFLQVERSIARRK